MQDGDDDPWEKAILAFVVGSAMPDMFPEWDNVQEPSWGWGAFYAYDSNSVDERCRWLPAKNLYDCPGGIIPWGEKFIPKKVDLGAGGYPAGNPGVNAENGGGTGCHWGGAHGYFDINQFNGNDGSNTLVQNRHCECSYAYKSESWDPVNNGWAAWVKQFHEVAMGGNQVYSDFQDLAQCWSNNPRDMINLQNALWWSRTTWNDQKSPLADYYNADDYVHWRRYWGWNEVPVSREAVQNRKNWDAVVIYLPAGVCSTGGVDSPYCLSSALQKNIDESIDSWVKQDYLKVGAENAGKRPGSYVVFARQNRDSTNNYQTEFFCQSWAHSGNQYKVSWTPSSATATGACWVEWNHGKEDLSSTQQSPKADDAPTHALASTDQADSSAAHPDHAHLLKNFGLNVSKTFVVGDQTSVTTMINQNIRVGTYQGAPCYGCYNGGKGILVRNPFDGYEDKPDWQAVPTTLLTNDVVAPTSVFPTATGWLNGNGNPDCPNDGTNGYKKLQKCPKDSRTGETGPWTYATTAYVVASEDSLSKVFMDFENIQAGNWGWGVFYPTDSNSVDQRCRYLKVDGQYEGYDCPGGWIPWGGTYMADPPNDPSRRRHSGSGSWPPGNPEANSTWGGGTGCHFGEGAIIDQTPVDSPNYLADKSCQCNYNFKSNWEDWVKTWIAHAHNYRQEDGWFAGGGKKAPGHALDQAMCWMNNPRDMINLQNHLYLRRYDWANQISPKSHWDDKTPASLRPYWGWNEVPVSRTTIRDWSLRDAVMIKLPAAICPPKSGYPGDGGGDSLTCLGKGQGENLEGDLDIWVKNGILKVGPGYVDKRPGSYVVIMREWMHTIAAWGTPDNWSKWFFCENWTSPNGKYKVVSYPTGSGNYPYGACYIDFGPHPSQGTEVFV